MAKRIDIDVSKLEQLHKLVQKADKKDSPAAEAARERIRLAFMSSTKGDGLPRLEGTLHCLRLMEIAGEEGFQGDPEEQLLYLATAIERIGALAAELNRIEVRS